MIFVAGVSGSGKTYMLRRLAERRPDILVVSGSRTLSSLGRPLQALTFEEALDNQWVLLEALAARNLIGKALAMLDGHALIETSTGPMTIPDSWYDTAGFTGFIHVEAAPATVARRRAGRSRSRTERDIAELQSLERSELLRQSERMARPYLAARSDEAEAIEAWLERVISSPAGDEGSR